jgi:TonB family protein
MKVLLIFMTAIICSVAVLVVHKCIVSEQSDAADTLSCELEVPLEYQVEPKLLPNYPEGEAYVVPHEEIIPDTDPEFPGGMSALAAYIKKNQKMPKAARRVRISGNVYLAFEVSAGGEIRDIDVLKGIGFGCDEEAVRLISAMPKWKPAEKDGKSVSSRFNMPVPFGIYIRNK